MSPRTVLAVTDTGLWCGGCRRSESKQRDKPFVYEFRSGKVQEELERQTAAEFATASQRVRIAEEAEVFGESAGPDDGSKGSDEAEREAKGEEDTGSEGGESGGKDDEDKDIVGALSRDANMEAFEKRAAEPVADPFSLLQHIGGQRGASIRHFDNEQLDEFYQAMKDKRAEWSSTCKCVPIAPALGV